MYATFDANGHFSQDAFEHQVRDEAQQIELSEVFSLSEFHQSVKAALNQLTDYLSDDSIRGLALTEPQQLLQQAKQLMTQPPQTSNCESREQKLKAILELYIKTGIQVHSPGYMGRQFSGVIPLSGVFDLVNSIVNQPSSFYEAGQLPNVVERLMAQELNRYIGYADDNFAMVTTSGGSLANMTALLGARNKAYPGFWTQGAHGVDGPGIPAIAVNSESHYSISRAAGILGIGERQLVRLPDDGHGRIDVSKAADALNKAREDGLDVFALVAAAGTTSTCAFDDLTALAEICQSRGIWLHVDAAHGGSLLLSERLKPQLKGIELADSFAWDAHKMLFVPAMCTLLFYKDKNNKNLAFSQEASYVFEKQQDIYTEYDSAPGNFECTKRPLIMNLWVCWAIYGKALFARKVELLCDLATQAHHKLTTLADFEVLHQPQANILCFRYLPEGLTEAQVCDFQLMLRNRSKARGRFFISKVSLKGKTALRVVFMNHDITMVHFDAMLDELRAIGQAWLEAQHYPGELALSGH